MRRASFAGPAQGALAATIAIFVLGSSSVRAIEHVCSPLRWPALAVFTGLAVLWARSRSVGIGRLLPVAVPALCLSALATASSAWSVAPLFTFEHAAAFMLMLVGTGSFAAATRDKADAVLAAEAVIAVATLACLAGPIVYAFVPAEAAQVALVGTPFRWSGLGVNPNTLPMLCALALLLAVWLVLGSNGPRRALFAVASVVLGAQIVASGARDGAIAVVVGSFVFAFVSPATGRRRRVAFAGAAAISAALIGGIVMMDRTALPAVVAPSTAPLLRAAPTYPRLVLPTLNYEFGSLPSGRRTFFGSGGRVQALREAFHQGSERPIAGWGFGTEPRVFINRVAEFQSGRAENSYLGFYLELGALGPALWILMGLLVLASVVAARRRSDAPSRLALAALAGVVAAGYALGIGQSYVYSVGNVATITFWTMAFLTAALSAKPRSTPPRVALAAALVAVFALVPVAFAGRWERAHVEATARTGIVRIWNRLGARLNGPGLDGFRMDDPVSLRCLIYAAGGTPTGYELCFDHGALVEAFDRRGGAFHVWTLQPFGSSAATVTVAPADVDRELRRLGGFGPSILVGPGYLVRPR